MAKNGVKMGRFRFAPSLLMTLLTMLLLALLVRLGFWQLQRAEEKRVLLALHEQRLQQQPIGLDASMDDMAAVVHRRVVAAGHFDAGHQVLLDNQIHQGVAGYHVLTPLILEGRRSAVLVNRGWLPVGKSRSQLPALPLPATKLSITGVASAPPATIFELSPGEAYTAGWPKVAQHVRPDELAVQLHYPLLPFVVLLDGDQDHGFVRDWKVVGMQPGKHSSYAMQWFGLAALLLLLYVLMNTRRVTMNETQGVSEE